MAQFLEITRICGWPNRVQGARVKVLTLLTTSSIATVTTNPPAFVTRGLRRCQTCSFICWKRMLTDIGPMVVTYLGWNLFCFVGYPKFSISKSGLSLHFDWNVCIPMEKYEKFFPFLSDQNWSSATTQIKRIKQIRAWELWISWPPNIKTIPEFHSKFPPNFKTIPEFHSKFPPNIKTIPEFHSKFPPNIKTNPEFHSKFPPNIKTNPEFHSKFPPNIKTIPEFHSKFPPNIKTNPEFHSKFPPNIKTIVVLKIRQFSW